MVKRTRFFCTISLIVLMFPMSRAEAISFYGGNGLLRISSANTVFQGDLWGDFNLSYNQGSISAGTYRIGRGSVGLLYGINHYLEFGFNQVFYQDRPLAISGGGSDPGTGPLRVSLKGVFPTSAPSTYNVGLQAMGTIPVGNVENVELESYYSDKVSFGGMIIFTVDSNPVDLRRSRRFHINIGYMNHNDKDSNFQAAGGSNETTEQILFGVGVQFPIGFQGTVFGELTGEHFLNNNPFITPAVGDTTGAAKDYVRFTPGIRYQVGRVGVIAGVDLRVTGSDNFGPSGDFVSVYPSWKTQFTLQYRLAEGVPPTFRRGRRMRISGRSYYGYGPATISSRSIGPGVIQSFEERQELLNQIETDLEALREQRIRAQRELEELKKSLESTSP